MEPAKLNIPAPDMLNIPAPDIQKRELKILEPPSPKKKRQDPKLKKSSRSTLNLPTPKLSKFES